jgi:uncharacterized protein YwqG
MAIGLKFQSSAETLEAQSKWWGAPDLPLDVDYPCASDGEPLLFICQIRLEDIAQYDTENQLPHKGMLYFFADMAEYVAPLEGISGEEHNGLGEWSESCFKVIYSPTCDNLETFAIVDDDDEPAFLEAEKIEFSAVEGGYDSFKLLGRPYYDEIAEQYPDDVCLLQIDESDEWGLRLYDCGMICFLISKQALAAQRWDEVKVYFHSF